MLRHLMGRLRPGRHLSKVEHVVPGDIIEFGFCDMNILSDRRFEVLRKEERDFGDRVLISWLIGAQYDTLSLQPSPDGHAGDIVVKTEINRLEVETVFDMRAFVTVFQQGFTKHVPLFEVPARLAEWLDGEGYVQHVDARPGRSRTPPDGGWLDYDFYALYGRSSTDRTIEIEVYPNETRVFACRAFPHHVIERLWPAGGA